MSERLTAVWAFVAHNPDGSEAIVAGQLPDGTVMPLLAVSRDQMEGMRPAAQQIADFSGMDITVTRFTVREDEGTIVPAE